MQKYINRIRHLLDLSDSPNEHEAMAAMLKAQELMAKYHVSEEDLAGRDQQNTVQEIAMEGYTYSKRRDYWMHPLSCLIASNYRCEAFASMEKQTRTVCFAGYSEDLEICVMVFEYATSCIRTAIKDIRKTGKNTRMSAKELTTVSDSYAYGFVCGLAEAYEKQKGDMEQYSLTVLPPKIVEDHFSEDGFSEKPAKKDILVEPDTFKEGSNDGRSFNPESRIEKGEDAMAIDAMVS